MGILGQKQRAADAVFAAVLSDRLSDSQDVPLIEPALPRRPAVSGGAEGHAMRRHGRVGQLGVVGREELGDIFENGSGRWLTGERMH